MWAPGVPVFRGGYSERSFWVSLRLALSGGAPPVSHGLATIADVGGAAIGVRSADWLGH